MTDERVQHEKALRRGVLAGDEQAWRTWYDAEFASLHAYALWRCGGLNDLADEIVQETWLTAVQRIRAFDPEAGAFAGWLRGIVTHLLRNHFRRQQRRNGVAPSRPDTEPADAALLRRELAERVGHALSELPDHYEAALRAKYLEGRSVQEIAEARGETTKAAESLLTRARQAFRDVFGGETPHE